MSKFQKTLFWLVLALLAASLAGGYFLLKKERAVNQSNLIAARDTIKQYSVKIAGLENYVSLKNAIIETQKDAIEAGLIEKDRLKALHLKEIVTNTELQATIRILRDSLKLQPGTVIITVKDTSGISHDYVRIPFLLLNEKDKYLSLTAGMDAKRYPYFDLTVPVSGEMTIGYKKDGFLKTKAVGIFTTTSPYLSVNNMDILIIKEPEKWSNKWYVHALFGVIAWETGRYVINNYVINDNNK